MGGKRIMQALITSVAIHGMDAFTAATAVP
jgi:hypothetical protein